MEGKDVMKENDRSRDKAERKKEGIEAMKQGRSWEQ